MTALSERKIEIVKTLVETAPDTVVGSLQAALADTSPTSALGSVRELVETEVKDRRLRNIVLNPILPMFRGITRGESALAFPYRALGLLWRAMKETAPHEVATAERVFTEFSAEDMSSESFDQLCHFAANGLREKDHPLYAETAKACDEGRAGGAESLAICLDVSHVARKAVQRLPDWLANSDANNTFAARLAYKDSVAISDEAGICFCEMLASHMAQPYMILRIISAVMDRPSERYLAESEMSVFAFRVMDEIDETLRKVMKIDSNGGPDHAVEVGRNVELVTLMVAEMETCIEMQREAGWGLRVAKQKRSLASIVEGRFRECEKLVMQALPSSQARLRRIRRNLPKLEPPPNASYVNRAKTMLTFIRDIRSSANYGGFAASRSRAIEKIAAYIDHYVEEVLDLVKTGDAPDEAVALAFLEIAADFSFLIHGEKAAELVRRRAISAAQYAEATAAAEAGITLRNETWKSDYNGNDN